MLIMVYVRSSRDPRAYIQNGFWFFKALIFIGLCVGAFYIPRNGSFEEIFMYFGLVGGFLFIVIQLILIIDFVHTWNESWVEKFENGNREYYYGLMIFTVLFYIAAIVVAVLGYIYYASVTIPKNLFNYFKRKKNKLKSINFRTLAVDCTYSSSRSI